MKRINDFFRRLAGMVVTYQANRIYRKAKKTADIRHEREHTMIYVALSPLDRRKLDTFNRKQFRAIKELMKRRDPRYSVVMMKDGAFYHTADRGENNGLTEKEQEARRLAFVRYNLQMAKLI